MNNFLLKLNHLLIAGLIFISLTGNLMAKKHSDDDEKAAPSSNMMIVTLGQFINKTSGKPELFRSLIDRMTNAIINTRKFEVIDQNRLKEFLKQHQLADAGIVDSEAASAPKKGKIKAAGFKIYGTVLTLGVSEKVIKGGDFTGNKKQAMVELNVRFADIETGRAIASKIVKVVKTRKNFVGANAAEASNDFEVLVQAAIEEAAQQVTNKLMDLAFPVKIIHKSRRTVTLNVTEERAHVGDIWEVFETGEELTDPDTGESLGASEEYVGEIKIIRVMPKFAKAKPIGDLEIDDLEKGMICRPVSKEKLKAKKRQEYMKKKRRFIRRF